LELIIPITACGYDFSIPYINPIFFIADSDLLRIITLDDYMKNNLVIFMKKY